MRTTSIRGRGGSIPNRGGSPNDTQRQNFFSGQQKVLLEGIAGDRDHHPFTSRL
jgi:hypothetical protein